MAEIGWTRLPFRARTRDEFQQGLTDWLGHVFYDVLPELGFEVREEQIYTSFRMARALLDGTVLMAEAGPGTGKTFAYLLPAICYARFKGAPVIVSSASSLLQTQLTDPEGDIQTLSRLLDLTVDARLAEDPAEFICEMKVDRPAVDIPFEGWDEFRRWAVRTGTGRRREVPDLPDESWRQMSWESTLSCDICSRRGHCHVMSARRRYRGAADLVICDHRLFAADLLTRGERLDAGHAPLLPTYSAVVFDEGHHLAETWQRAQGFRIGADSLAATLSQTEAYLPRLRSARTLALAQQKARLFMREVLAAAEFGEGKRALQVSRPLAEMACDLGRALSAVETELATEEAMSEGTEAESVMAVYQARLEEAGKALRLFSGDGVVLWVEEKELWIVPERPRNLFGKGRLAPGLPVVFSSATLEADYTARVLEVGRYDASRVGVPFDLGEQMLVYQPPGAAGVARTEGAGGRARAQGTASAAGWSDTIQQTLDLIRTVRGRTLVLLNSLAEVRRYREALVADGLPWTLLFEGEGDRATLLERFRHEVSSVLVGATFWEGVDVVGEALTCCVIPALPFPAHDPLIRQRREQAQAAGHDPFVAVDLPEMLLKLKQGAGRLIRSAEDRGVLALLDRSYVGQPWEEAVRGALPEDAEWTADLAAVAEFCNAKPGDGQ